MSSLRALRFLRRQCFSLLSAAILAGTLAVALTDAGFRSARSPDAEAIAADALPVGLGPRSPGVIIYYIVESPEQARVLSNAVRNDTRWFLAQGWPARQPMWIYFLLFETPEQEAHGARFLNQIAEMAPHEGFSLTVVDLTR